MYSKILVPLDGSNLAEKAIPYAQGLAKTYGSTVHLLQIIPPHISYGFSRGDDRDAGEGIFRTSLAELAGGAQTGSGNSDPSDTYQEQQLEGTHFEEAKGYLEGVASQLKEDGLNVVIQLLEGAPHEHITQYANRNDVDIIIMSTHGHGGVKRLIMGSTTDRVIRLGDVPVLVVTSGSSQS